MIAEVAVLLISIFSRKLELINKELVDMVKFTTFVQCIHITSSPKMKRQETEVLIFTLFKPYLNNKLNQIRRKYTFLQNSS